MKARREGRRRLFAAPKYYRSAAIYPGFCKVTCKDRAA